MAEARRRSATKRAKKGPASSRAASPAAPGGRTRPSTALFRQIFEQGPLPTLVVDRELAITYANTAARRHLERLQHLIHVRADALVGADVDVFGAMTPDQRAALADPAQLPLRLRLTLGDEGIELQATALFDTRGRYRGPIVTWAVVTEPLHHAGAVLEAVSAAMQRTDPTIARIREGLELLGEIASKTSLLALNAALQAARVGEPGDGIAVLADEIHALAERASRQAQGLAPLVAESAAAASDLALSAEAQELREPVRGFRTE